MLEYIHNRRVSLPCILFTFFTLLLGCQSNNNNAIITEHKVNSLTEVSGVIVNFSADSLPNDLSIAEKSLLSQQIEHAITDISKHILLTGFSIEVTHAEKVTAQLKGVNHIKLSINPVESDRQQALTLALAEAFYLGKRMKSTVPINHRFAQLISHTLANDFALFVIDNKINTSVLDKNFNANNMVALLTKQAARDNDFSIEEVNVGKLILHRYYEYYIGSQAANIHNITAEQFSRFSQPVDFQRKSLAEFAIRTPDFPGQEKVTDLAKQARANIGFYLLEGYNKQKQIALTFDDGPDPKNTELIMTVLAKYDAKATFFWMGENIKRAPEFIAKAVAAGHTVGNHSWDHPHSKKLSNADFWQQVNDTNLLLAQHLGYQPRFFRPPYGEISQTQINLLTNKNIMTLLWSIDTRDWYQKPWVHDQPISTAEYIANRVINNKHPESIVLMHDAGGDRTNTARALEKIIPYYQQKGYEFVTLETMLGIGNRL